MANNRTFWMGALCGAAVAYLAERLLHRRPQPKARLEVVGGTATVFPLKRDEAAGDPFMLASDRSRSRPGFERSGGAPGGATAAEVQEVPGHPGQRLDHSDPAQPVRSARTHIPPPARDSQA